MATMNSVGLNEQISANGILVTLFCELFGQQSEIIFVTSITSSACVDYYPLGKISLCEAKKFAVYTYFLLVNCQMLEDMLV